MLVELARDNFEVGIVMMAVAQSGSFSWISGVSLIVFVIAIDDAEVWSSVEQNGFCVVADVVGNDVGIDWHAVEKMVGERGAVDGNDNVIGASFPNLEQLAIEFGSRLRIDDEAYSAISCLDNALQIICSDVPPRSASNGDDFQIFCRVAVVSFEKFCLGFLKCWFESGCLLLFCHKNSIPSLEKLCYNMVHHVCFLRARRSFNL